MSEKLVTSALNSLVALQIVQAVAAGLNASFYVFAAKHTPYEGGDQDVPTPEETESYRRQVYRDMLFGKRITPYDLNLLSPRHDWVSGTRYDRYDDSDPDLLSKAFYVSVENGFHWHVFKCLDNARGAPSTVAPDYDSVSPGDPYFETSDGYVWKYIYSITNTVVRKFATETLFPVTTFPIQSGVDEVVPRAGAIDVISVDYPGGGYSNYVAGNNVMSVNHLRLNGNNLTYDISANSQASGANGYYEGCYIYIKGGNNNEAGQFRRIVDYFVNATSKVIALDVPFANALGSGAVFDIYPGVDIVGSGQETSPAAGRAIVNAYTNSVHRIEMLDNGRGYVEATASVSASPEIVVDPAVLRVINSPYHGHGSDPVTEFGATWLGVSTSFEGSESGTIPVENEYRTIGMLQTPAFANVVVHKDGTSGLFLNGETVYEIHPVRLGTGAVLDASNPIITDAAGDFVGQFSPGRSVYFEAETNDGNSSFLSTVLSVTNSSHMVLASNSSFSGSNVSYYVPNESSQGTVVTSNSTTVTVTSIVGIVDSGDVLLGGASGTKVVVDHVERGGVQKGFTTFVAADKYDGMILSGSFVESEEVVQAATGARAYLYAIESGSFYLTDRFGNFDLTSTVTGQDSGATAQFTASYGSELEYMSGNILYLENMTPIPRANGQSETFKLVFDF